MSTVTRVNRCQFCGKTFTRKNWYVKHSCAKKKKFEDLNDFTVQKAYRMYLYWMRITSSLKVGNEPDMEKFLKSPYLDRFVEITKFVSESSDITSGYSYLDWLVAERIPDNRWAIPDGYDLDRYREFVQIDDDPADHARQFVEFVRLWVMDRKNRTVEQFFNTLSAPKVLSLVHQRKVRPWVLFGYPPVADRWLFEPYYNAEVYYRVNELVNCDHWSDKVASSPSGVKIVEKVIAQIWDSRT